MGCALNPACRLVQQESRIKTGPRLRSELCLAPCFVLVGPKHKRFGQFAPSAGRYAANSPGFVHRGHARRHFAVLGKRESWLVWAVRRESQVIDVGSKRAPLNSGFLGVGNILADPWRSLGVPGIRSG